GVGGPGNRVGIARRRGGGLRIGLRVRAGADLRRNRIADRHRARRRETSMTDFTQLPEDLPVPKDDGAADHLPGRQVPDVTLAATSGEAVVLGDLGPGRTIVYIYPMTGQPDVALPDGWDAIPGARGCTTEACDFRDHHAELLGAGAARVFGLSSQDTDYQREMVERLGLPFGVLSDSDLILAD